MAAREIPVPDVTVAEEQRNLGGLCKIVFLFALRAGTLFQKSRYKGCSDLTAISVVKGNPVIKFILVYLKTVVVVKNAVIHIESL